MTDSNDTGMNDFLLEEYAHIADAHFKSIETISTFFRHYLFLMTVPLTILGLSPRMATSVQSANLMVEYTLNTLPWILCVVSLVGLGMMWYITNLRLDAILYARTINGIRKLFYDNSTLDISQIIRSRVLPQTTLSPSYWESSYFLAVVLVFGFIDGLIFACSYPLLLQPTSTGLLMCGCYCFAGFLIIHIFVYYIVTRHRDLSYLRSNILGVDIDGVLNNHREQFCDTLLLLTGKKLNPSDITQIPVHEIPGIQVTSDNERMVFNHPFYWHEMPARIDAQQVLRKLHNAFGMKIWIFTYRPWPDAEHRADLQKLLERFAYVAEPTFLGYIAIKFFPKNVRLIYTITKNWLNRNNFVYDKLYIERGNEHCADARTLSRNRFRFAQQHHIRWFVEDDLEKAIKLSYFCDVVFLLSHPYNEWESDMPVNLRDHRQVLPKNVIRVQNWQEIYKRVRSIS
jgi:uncharacterized HAD superfamily protein